MSVTNLDPFLLAQLKDQYDVPEYRVIKSVFHTNNAGVDEALAWLEEHKNDADIDHPVKFRNGELISVDSPDVDLTNDENITDDTLTENVSDLKNSIKKETVDSLIDMGFALIASEKAVFLTTGSIEDALQWLEKNADEPTRDVPLSPAFVEKQLAKTCKVKLSPEEAQARAMALQAELHARRAAREKQEAFEKEKNRLLQGKAMVEQQRLIEESERQRNLELQKREKAAFEKEKERQKELLRRDYQERFGVPMPEEKEEDDELRQIMKKSSKDRVVYFLGRMHRENITSKSTISVEDFDNYIRCLSTLVAYVSNLKKNDSKFFTIKKNNPAFQARVAPYAWTTEILDAVGFKPQHVSGEDVFLLSGCIADGFIVDHTLKFLNLMIEQANGMRASKVSVM